MTYTAFFDEIRKDDIALAGGKGANLGELSHAGLPVPPGFVLITTAYDAFVEANAIQDTIVGRAANRDRKLDEYGCATPRLRESPRSRLDLHAHLRRSTSSTLTC